MTKLRVLHVHSGNLYGGVETTLVKLARLRDRCPDMESSYALCFDGRLSDELMAAGAVVHRLGGVRFRWPWTVLNARMRLRRLLDLQPFDVAISHGAWGHALFAQPLRRRKIPNVFWLHDIPNGTHWLEQLAKRFPPALVLANSQYTSGKVGCLFPNAPVKIQYPFCIPLSPVDQTSRERIRREFSVPPGSAVIITACRLERCKGQGCLIDALAKLSAVGGWRCWIVGGIQRPSDRAYLSELQRAATQARIADRVAFLGQRRDVPELLGAADIYCQPNIGPETFGQAFVEALAMGLPVVTTSFGGALEIVDETCGILIAPGDSVELAKSLQTLISDTHIRQRLGAAGPGRALELCDPAVRMPQLHQILQQVTASGMGLC
jgi:glycosyltransferase involved in cell wall biosynthesis